MKKELKDWRNWAVFAVVAVGAVALCVVPSEGLPEWKWAAVTCLSKGVFCLCVWAAWRMVSKWRAQGADCLVCRMAEEEEL